MKTGGQITLGIGAIIGTVTIVVSVLGAYYSAQVSNAEKFGGVQSDISSLVAKQEDQETTNTRVDNTLNEVNGKLDQLLLHFGLNNNK